MTMMNGRVNDQLKSRSHLPLWISLGSLALFAYALITADPYLRSSASVALGFQIASWAVAMNLVVHRHPGRELRISDPGVLVLLWCAAYLLLPSVIWFQGGAIHWGHLLTTGMVVRLFWLHALFIAAFAVGYLVVPVPPVMLGKAAADRLPSGWLLYLLPLLPVAFDVFMRVGSGEGLFPTTTRGESWYALQESVRDTRALGGLAYIWTQIRSKTWFYPLLVQGVGMGLILTRTLISGHRRKRAFAFLVLSSIVLMLLDRSGSRSKVFLSLLTALVLADWLAGPVPWRYLATMLVVGLLAFELMGSLRVYRAQGLIQGLVRTVEEYSQEDTERLGEFTSLLSKEALGVELARTAGVEDFFYPVRSVLYLVPSQLLPSKLRWMNTADLLARELLGSLYYAGAGVAGAMIVDGYRFAREPGVVILALSLGVGISLLWRWAMQIRADTQTPLLLRVCLTSGFFALTFHVLRADLGAVIVLLVYNVTIPWLILGTLLRERQMSPWIQPVPVISSTK